MSCDEKGILGGILCMSTDDFYLMIFNIVVITTLLSIIYIRKILFRSKENLSMGLKNHFTLLGEGALSCFYTASNNQQKNLNAKKKLTNKSMPSGPIPIEKHSNNELKCNICQLPLEVTYQYTLSKLAPN